MSAGKLVLVIAMGFALSGCEEGQGNIFAPKPDAGAAAEGDVGATVGEAAMSRATDIPAADTEAPELFDKTDKALWDGRPSLGGTWVAHEDVGEPQRVIIRNKATGKSVIGALFRRERDNPGPKFQVSSDAADALGMLAGQPSDLEVVALKRIVKEKPPEPEAAPVEEVAATPADPAADTAITASPIDPAAGATPAPAESAAAAPADAATETPEGIAAAAAAAVGAAPEATSATDAAAAAALGDPGLAAPATAAKPLPKPFVEIGYFQQEANAAATAQQLQAAGLNAQMIAATVKNAPAWRVIVGPVATLEERAALIARLKAMGFKAAKASKG